MRNLDYTTADLNSPIADIKMDLHNIPFDDNTFDIVFCNHVLEHVRDDRQCVKEICRVLKPDGWAILQSPIDYSRASTLEDPGITSEADREKHFWQKDHLRLFGRDFKERLQESGLSVNAVDYIKEFSTEIVERYRLSSPKKDDIIYHCRKPSALRKE